MLNFFCKSFDELSQKELHDSFLLRSEVFVVEQNCVYQDVDGKDPYALHVLGKNKQNKVIAYARILPKGHAYSSFVSIGRVVISQEYRGKRLGHVLVQFSVEQAIKKYKESLIKISAQSHLIPFYNFHGFQADGKEYLEDGIPHTAMILST
tara:strand:+ start:76 stop:528 length:453 start_codon:yes stop_codon:yes gene_type:complete